MLKSKIIMILGQKSLSLIEIQPGIRKRMRVCHIVAVLITSDNAVLELEKGKSVYAHKWQHR